MAKKNKKKSKGFITILFFIISLFTSLFAIYEIYLLNSIENLIRYIVIGLLVLIDFIIFIKVFRNKPKKFFLILFMILYSVICFGLGYFILYVYGKVDHLNKKTVIFTADLVVMNTSQASSVQDIKNMKLGLIKSDISKEIHKISQDIIKENKLEDENQIIDYDDYTTMVSDLYNGEVQGIFIGDDYKDTYSTLPGYENIASDTKIIIQKEEEFKKASISKVETESLGKKITEPFTILLMGIDSTDEVLSKNAIANGDTLILITFNPKTLNATMLSIPRDSYVPIACFSNRDENKITHASAYGNDCMMNTIENYFDVNIDYYAKINFKGLVKLVNAVGGVEVDVPKRLCTDDSSRANEICIEEGHQILDGEHALVFARNRKQLENGDFGRAEHQREIIIALMNKLKSTTDVKVFTQILDTISNSIDTNLTSNQILSFYNIGKDILKKRSTDTGDLIDIQQLYLQGDGQMIYDERAKMVLWDYIPNKNSKNDIIRAMKENLGLVDHTAVTEFSFSINEPYEKKVIGYGPYKTSNTYTLLPDFTGDTEQQARATASRLGISVSFKGTGGHVVSQSEPAKRRVDKIRSVTLTLSQGSSKKEDEKEEKEKSKKENTKIDEDDDKEKEKDKDKDSTEDNGGNSNSGNNGNGNQNDSGSSTGDDDTGNTPSPSPDSSPSTDEPQE